MAACRSAGRSGYKGTSSLGQRRFTHKRSAAVTELRRPARTVRAPAIADASQLSLRCALSSLRLLAVEHARSDPSASPPSSVCLPPALPLSLQFVADPAAPSLAAAAQPAGPPPSQALPSLPLPRTRPDIPAFCLPSCPCPATWSEHQVPVQKGEL